MVCTEDLHNVTYKWFKPPRISFSDFAWHFPQPSSFSQIIFFCALTGLWSCNCPDFLVYLLHGSCPDASATVHSHLFTSWSIPWCFCNWPFPLVYLLVYFLMLLQLAILPWLPPGLFPGAFGTVYSPLVTSWSIPWCFWNCIFSLVLSLATVPFRSLSPATDQPSLFCLLLYAPILLWFSNCPLFPCIVLRLCHRIYPLFLIMTERNLSCCSMSQSLVVVAVVSATKLQLSIH